MPDPEDDWPAQFRQYAAACRVMTSLPPRDALTPAQEHQCRTIGGTILTWLREAGPRFLQERAALAGTLGIDPEPVIVFTSDVPGAVAAQQIIGPDHPRVIYLLESEYAPLLDADATYKRHIHFWSVFRQELDPALAAEAHSKHPIPAGCSYWQHSEGTRWAASAGRGGEHLWQWDGAEPTLLHEAMTHWLA